MVAFHRPYKRLGVEKGDELRVAGVDHKDGVVILEGRHGGETRWEPGRLAARSGGVEVYRVEQMEFRSGDRVRWTRNDKDLGLVNSQTAEVTNVRGDRVTFRLEDGHALDMTGTNPQLRHVDQAWASTVHAFQGRTVDTVIAAMEANHPNLINQKTLYAEISRARDRAELVTDDAKALRERLEAATGERIAALEAFGDRQQDLVNRTWRRNPWSGGRRGRRKFGLHARWKCRILAIEINRLLNNRISPVFRQWRICSGSGIFLDY